MMAGLTDCAFSMLDTEDASNTHRILFWALINEEHYDDARLDDFLAKTTVVPGNMLVSLSCRPRDQLTESETTAAARWQGLPGSSQPDRCSSLTPVQRTSGGKAGSTGEGKAKDDLEH
jgi:hypothetical protein